MSKLYSILLSLFVANTLYAQPCASVDCINTDDLKQMVKILSDKSFYGRNTGTSGQKKAAEYIAEKYMTIGLKPMVRGSYYQKFNLNRFYWDEIIIEAKDKRLTNFDDFIYTGSKVINEEKEYDIVFGGDGSEECLNQIKVEGKIVLLFSSNLRADGFMKADSLLSKGAIGIVYTNPDNDNQFIGIKKTMKYHLLKTKYSFIQDEIREEGDRLCWLISKYRLKQLIGYTSKELYQKMNDKMLAEVSMSSFSVLCKQVSDTIETENVLGFIPGKSDSSLVISAHYDHIGGNEQTYFPGADDNASGVAAMLEIAEAFSQQEKPECNIIFLAASAEEIGLLGSKYFVNDVLFKASRVSLNINLDMLGRVDKKHTLDEAYLYSIGTEKLQNQKRLLQQVALDYPYGYFDFSRDRVESISGWYQRSDQYNFHKKGVPAILFTSGGHSDYHKPSDTFDKINFDLLEHRARLIYLAINLIQKKIKGSL